MSVRPTNTWFENFMVESGRLPVHALPYLLRSAANGLDICYPTLDTTSYTTAIIAPMIENMSLRSTAGNGNPRLEGFTDLGATVVWRPTGGTMTADVVRGAAYSTMRYAGLTPVVATLHAMTSINGTLTGPFTGTKFKIVLNNGQTWILYSTSSITFTMSGQTLTATSAFTGSLRLAILPSGGTESALDAGATAIHTGGTVDMSITGTTYTKKLNFTFTGTGEPLTYTMPHHRDVLFSPTYVGVNLIGTLRGNLQAIRGAVWTLEMPVVVPGWNNSNPVRADRIAAVRTALAEDKSYIPTAYPYGINDTIADPYFGAKWQAKAGRLALIADQLGDTAARDQLLGNLKTVFTRYLIGGDPGTKLRYETNWGGLVSEKGLTDNGADFGNGVFNDHYFHYGYMIYAAAVIAKFDSTWLNTHKARINDLCRDIANPATGNGDPYFIPFRHFDHFEGHSWASGILEASQSNQESTSEAVNAWYGLYLWGLASNQPLVADLGKALFVEELRTAQKYWQIKQSDTIYSMSPSVKDKGCIGIVWSFKVDVGTWFSSMPAQLEHVHGIQILPVTPATELLIPDDWIGETWTRNLLPLQNRNPVPAASWWNVLVAAHGQTDPDDAWSRLVNVPAARENWDDGTSKTQLLYHVATFGGTVSNSPRTTSSTLAPNTSLTTSE